MYHFKQFLRLLTLSVLFWSFAFCIFIVIRFVDYGNEQTQEVFSETSPFYRWLHFGVILGILVGLFYAVIEFLFEKFITKNIYLGLSIALKSIIYLFLISFSFLFIIRLIELDIGISLSNEIGWWLNNAIFWVAITYFFLASFAFQFIKLANEKFGKGVLFNMLSGKYRKPTEETRLFMFVDLKSATSLAEDLGHYKYSQLLQDCFFDLNKLLDKYSAEVYQYVGDEAVVSWKYNKGIKNNRCIDLFFDFQKVLKKRSKYYEKHYGMMPVFKAGVHGGTLIVTEVGTLKKELAYHGDVINTTSRIQEACNKYDESFLISGEIISKIKLKSIYKAKPLGDLLLKGKQDPLKIYSIQKS